MSSSQSFVEYVCEQAGTKSNISYKKMFGEYALYIDEKVVALVCDDQVFLKQTVEGRNILKEPKEAAPYPGAKSCFCVTTLIDNRKLISSLFLATATALPAPKPKQIKKKKQKAAEQGAAANP